MKNYSFQNYLDQKQTSEGPIGRTLGALAGTLPTAAAHYAAGTLSPDPVAGLMGSGPVGIGSAFWGLPGKAGNIGSDIGDKVWGGIRKGWDWLRGKKKPIDDDETLGGQVQQVDTDDSNIDRYKVKPKGELSTNDLAKQTIDRMIASRGEMPGRIKASIDAKRPHAEFIPDEEEAEFIPDEEPTTPTNRHGFDLDPNVDDPIKVGRDFQLTKAGMRHEIQQRVKENIEKAKELKNKGNNTSEIARILGKSHSQIRWYLRQGAEPKEAPKKPVKKTKVWTGRR
jgi:hypothetical protein